MLDNIQAAFLKDITDDIISELDELVKKERNDYNCGEMNAYTHILRKIKFILDDDVLADFGLDVDIDKKYS
jgi:hypothetical protein